MEKIKHHKCWKRPSGFCFFFLKRLPENLIITKIHQKKMSAWQKRNIQDSLLSKLLLHDPFNTDDQVQQKGQACDFRSYDPVFSLIYLFWSRP